MIYPRVLKALKRIEEQTFEGRISTSVIIEVFSELYPEYEDKIEEIFGDKLSETQS